MAGATATAVVSGGVVTGITITNAGSGYTQVPTVTIAPPVAGATATAVAVDHQLPIHGLAHLHPE